MKYVCYLYSSFYCNSFVLLYIILLIVGHEHRPVEKCDSISLAILYCRASITEPKSPISGLLMDPEMGLLSYPSVLTKPTPALLRSFQASSGPAEA
jgi:hypothetical protein